MTKLQRPTIACAGNVLRPDHLRRRARRRRGRRRRRALGREAPGRTFRGQAGHRLRHDAPVVGGARLQRRKRQRLLGLRRVVVDRSEILIGLVERRVGIEAEVDVVDLAVVARIPFQLDAGGREVDGRVGRRQVDRLVGRLRHELGRLDRADRVEMAGALVRHAGGPGARAPLPQELILEVVEHPRLEREVVVLLLLIGRRRRPVGGAEDGQRTGRADRRRVVVEEHQLLVVQPGVAAHAQRHAGGVQLVEVVGHPLPVREPVFLVVADHANRDPALHRRDDQVGLALVGDAVHDHVEPFQFLRIALRETVLVVLRLRKIQRRSPWCRSGTAAPAGS